MKGKNMTHLKQDNRKKILLLLHDKPLSRKDIAEQLNLTPAAVTILTNEMIEEKWLVQKGSEGTGTVGRRKIILGINEKFKKVIGVYIDQSKYHVGLATLDYEIIVEEQHEIKDRTPQGLLKDVIGSIYQLLGKNSIPLEDLFGIGVGIVGAVKDNKSEHAYGLWDETVAIADILHHEFKRPVEVENNVRALAEAELVKGPLGSNDNMIYMKYGPGVGSALILNRHLYKGSHHVAGEIGHLAIHNSTKVCSCGKTGCLEAEISQSALEEALKMSTDVIIKKYDEKDEYVVQVIHEKINLLAFVLNNQITMLDPDVLIVHGDLFKHEGLYDYFREQVNPNVKVICSHIKEKSLAGVSVLLRRAFYFKGAL